MVLLRLDPRRAAKIAARAIARLSSARFTPQPRSPLEVHPMSRLRAALLLAPLALVLSLTAARAEQAPATPSSAAQVAAVQPAPRNKGKQTQVAVLDLAAVGAPAELAQNLTAIVAAEVGRYDDVKPITRREVAALLDVERQKEMLGCTDDGCVSALVGALGVQKIVSGQIGKVESAFVLTLHVIDTRTGKVDGRVIRTVPVESQGLVNAVKSAVTDLIGAQVSSRNQPPRLAVSKKVVAHEEDKVSLDASRCFDPDGDPLRYRWQQLDGPPALLENPEQPQASFTAAEVGTYTFAVEVTDGRSSPQEQRSEVEVRRRRPFSLAPAFQTLLSFNRIAVSRDDPTMLYRNRSLMGGAVLAELKFSERWGLTAELGANHMESYPESDPAKGARFVEVKTIHFLVGARVFFPFEIFRLYLGLSGGIGRRYYSASFGDTPETAASVSDVNSEAVIGEASGGVDIPAPTLFGVPLGEYVGLFAQGGIRAIKGTDVVRFPAVPIELPGNGFQWGVNGTLGFYVRF
ncbi:MAG: hypothetical protein HY901_33800 [Deltaproteobacteria bacterium]|nr:hypothetical protein [Deltaproteobacteria bacterium]